MTHLAGHDRSQTLLLPESLDDYIGPDPIDCDIVQSNARK